jgi:ferredoxin
MAGLSRRAFGVRTLAALASVGVGALTARLLLQRAREQAPDLLRPPGAQDEQHFLANCIRCGQCVEACPEQELLERQSLEESMDPDAPKPREFVDRPLRLADLATGVATGTPFSVPRDCSCDLCAGRDEMQCIAACPTDALQRPEELLDIDMGVAVLDQERCYAWNGTMCKACWHACPFPNQALRTDYRGRAEIVPDVCIGCGLCDYACLTEPSSIRIVTRRERDREAARSGDSSGSSGTSGSTGEGG